MSPSLDVMWQPAMTVRCRLAHLERMAPLQVALRGTSFLLGERLAGLVAAFWQVHPETDLRRAADLQRFAGFLRARLAAGDLEDPYLEEVLAFEQALEELRLAPAPQPRTGGPSASGPLLVLHPGVRLVTFRHDPASVLGHVALGVRPPAELEPGVHFLVLRAEGARVSFHTLPPEVGEAAQTVKVGSAAELTGDERARLVEAGLVVGGP